VTLASVNQDILMGNTKEINDINKKNSTEELDCVTQQFLYKAAICGFMNCKRSSLAKCRKN
jgi:hypothetical protein